MVNSFLLFSSVVFCNKNALKPELEVCTTFIGLWDISFHWIGGRSYSLSDPRKHIQMNQMAWSQERPRGVPKVMHL